MSRYSVVHCLLLPVAVIAIGYGFVKAYGGGTFSRALLLAAIAVTGAGDSGDEVEDFKNPLKSDDTDIDDNGARAEPIGLPDKLPDVFSRM